MRRKLKSLYGRMRLIHRRRTYTLRELAAVLGRSYWGVKKWPPKGLKSIGGKPALFLGEDVINFLKCRRRDRSRPTVPGTLFCMRCKVPRAPASASLAYVPRSAKVGRLVGYCECCGAKMSQTASSSRLAETMPGIVIRTETIPP